MCLELTTSYFKDTFYLLVKIELDVLFKYIRHVHWLRQILRKKNIILIEQSDFITGRFNSLIMFKWPYWTFKQKYFCHKNIWNFCLISKKCFWLQKIDKKSCNYNFILVNATHFVIFIIFFRTCYSNFIKLVFDYRSVHMASRPWLLSIKKVLLIF